MPILHLHCTTAWMPGATPFTARFARALRGMALPELLKELWGEEVSPGAIGVVYHPQDRHNVNMPDIWVVLRPLYSSTRASALVPMIDGLDSSIESLVAALTVGSEAVPPTVEHDIDFQFGGGCSRQTGDSWKSEFPQGVNREQIESMLSRLRQHIDAPHSDAGARMTAIEGALDVIASTLAAAGGVRSQ